MMNFLGQLFRGGNKDIAGNLIQVAYNEGKLSSDQIDLINEEVEGISITKEDLKLDLNRVNRLRINLPSKEEEKFKVLFSLVKRFIRRGALDDRKKQVIAAIFSVIHNERSRVDELIESVISNIALGHSEDESFNRLGYLLKPRQINFN